MAVADEPDEYAVDENDLMAEWRRQPGLTRRVGRAEADARHAHAQAEAALKVTAARLKFQIRKDPGRFGLGDKPTIPDIEAACLTHKDHVAAVELVNRTRYELAIREADVAAMLDRRKALERLVELLRIEYFAEAEPRPVSAGGRAELERRRRRAARTDDEV